MKLKEKISDKISSSAILCALDRFSSFLYRQISESVLGRLFTSYEKEERTYENGLFSSFFRRKKKSRLLKGARYGVSRSFENSSFLGFLSKCTDYFLGCRLKVYGLFTLSFGIYTALIYIFKKYAFYLENSSVDHFYFGVGAIVVSLLLIPSSRTLSDALSSSRIMRYILSDTLGIRMENIVGKKAKKGGSGPIFFICGIAVGLATYAISPLYLTAFIFGLAALGMIFSYPEVGVLLTIFISPFIVFLPHPSLFLAGMLLVTALSFIIKLVRGKRTFKLELVDLAVFIFALLVFFGGVVSVTPSSSIRAAAVFVCFMLGYFLVVNLMKTKLWLRRAISVLTSSALIVSVYGILGYFTGAVNENWIDPEMFAEISGRAVSTFENPNMLAEYLIMILPFISALFIYSKKSHVKAAYFLSLCSVVFCIVCTWSRSAWLGAIVGMLLFFLLYSPRTIYALAALAALLPFAAYVVPQNVLLRFYSIGNVADSSTSYRMYLWKSVLRMIRDFPAGIGVGEGAFGYMYPAYTYAGMESAPHSHSIYFQTALEIGVIGILIFLVLLFFFSQSAFEYTSNSSDKRSRLMSNAGFCGIVAALVQGCADYIWYNYRVFFIFWVIIGIVCAYRRIGFDSEKSETRQYDENSAELDMKLSKRT